MIYNDSHRDNPVTIFLIGENMETIQLHEIKDIIRIEYGVILEVHKYRRVPNSPYVHIDSKDTGVVKGCKGLRILKEDYKVKYNETTLSKGTYVYGNLFVEPETNVDNFRFEVKTSGGSMYGSCSEVTKTLSTISRLIESYKEKGN